MTLRHLYIMNTNIWISNVMQGIENFCGVYSIDNMKDPMSYPTCLIVNFSPSFPHGTHFIAIILGMSGVLLIVGSSLSIQSNEQFIGNIVAFIMPISFAILVIIIMQKGLKVSIFTKLMEKLQIN